MMLKNLVLLTAFTATSAAAQTTCPDPASLTRGMTGPMADVRYLADDQLEGREVGTAGAHCAGDYVAHRLAELGLRPGGKDGSYYHTFTIRKGAELTEGNRLTVDGRTLSLGDAWTPTGFSGSADLEGELTYGSHFLSRPGGGDQTEAQADVTGKIVVVEWGDPDAAGGATLRATTHFKATVAAGRHAAGILVLLPEGMDLPTMEGEIRNVLSIPVAVVSARQADAVRAAARAGAPVTLHTGVAPTMGEARNVVALLPGTDPELRDEYIVVGAHFDHLGYGGEGSLDPDSRAIHNGADDNASGTAGMLEMARLLTEGPRPARSVIFMGFTGEERGLWGSARWVADPTVPIEQVRAMINLDMVGRLRDNTLTVYGLGTATEWDGIVDRANGALAEPLTLARVPDGYGPSDHASFFAAGIPVLHFFTNTHAEYHRPEDDWDLINAEGIERIADLGARVTRDLAGIGTEAVTLTAVEQDRPAPAAEGSQRGYGPSLGTIPDMTPRDFGVRLTGVREGSPADRAGLQGGDVIVEFDGKEIADIYAYTYALRAKEPGDVVKIVVERDGTRVTLTAVLGESRR